MALEHCSKQNPGPQFGSRPAPFAQDTPALRGRWPGRGSADSPPGVPRRRGRSGRDNHRRPPHVQPPFTQMTRHFRPPICVLTSGSANVLSRSPESPERTGTQCGCGAAGSASPCQGEGRGFESRHPLGGIEESGCPHQARYLLRWSGRVVRQRPAKPSTRVRFPSPPPRRSDPAGDTRAISSAGERFPDTEEVTGSIPVSRTTDTAPRLQAGGRLSFRHHLPREPALSALANRHHCSAAPPRRSRSCLGESLHHRRERVADVVLCPRPRPCRLGNLVPALRVRQKRRDRFGERVGVARGHKNSSAT